MQRGLQLTLSGAGASGPWEAELVTMALTNLLDNAMDFSPAGSIIRIELDGTNVNQLTSQALTDMGRAPTFYDCLVEVQACAPHAAAGTPHAA